MAPVIKAGAPWLTCSEDGAVGAARRAGLFAHLLGLGSRTLEACFADTARHRPRRASSPGSGIASPLSRSRTAS
jgi:hypothetical protein